MELEFVNRRQLPEDRSVHKTDQSSSQWDRDARHGGNEDTIKSISSAGVPVCGRHKSFGQCAAFGTGYRQTDE
jgi:hypothetical protein